MKAKTFFRNAQWKVTNYGIECISPHRYEISATDMTGNRGDCYDLALHMGEKAEWVIAELFMEAFRAALVHNGHRVDEARFAKSLKCMQRQRADSQQFYREWERRTAGPQPT